MITTNGNQLVTKEYFFKATKFSNHETSNALEEYSRCKENVMLKVKVAQWHAYMQEQNGGEGIVPNPFATSVLERGGGQHHAPAALPPWKSRYPLYRTLGGPQSP